MRFRNKSHSLLSAFLAYCSVIIMIFIAISARAAPGGAPPNPPNLQGVIFTDPLYEDWQEKEGQIGSTALFDHNENKGAIEDICGPLAKYKIGRAYDNHKGWDRNIPNDNDDYYTVFAIAPGTVEKVRSNCKKGDYSCGGGTGNYVFIRHSPSVVSKIFHLGENEIYVKVDQWVDRFHPIGLGGSTGNSSGEHIHIQIEVDGIPVDPLDLKDNWSPKLVITPANCTTNPQTGLVTYEPLFLYAQKRISTLTAALENKGATMSKKQYWLLGTGGAYKEDVLLQDYTSNNEKSSILFDLTGNAPQAIYLPNPVLKWWYEHGSVYSFGKPVAVSTHPLKSTSEFIFEKGWMNYAPGTNTLIKKWATYPEIAGPGMYEDGWKGGKSYAIANCYAKNGGSETIGYPTAKDAKTAYVHSWWDYELQDFIGGTHKMSGIMLEKGSDNFKAHLIYGPFWNTYRSPAFGPQSFGHPLNDAYFDEKFNMFRQDFEKGKSILQSGEVIVSSLTCPAGDDGPMKPICMCIGSKKETTCGNCGTKDWICMKTSKNNQWTSDDICKNQGPCNPFLDAEESQICGKCGKGIQKRICDSNCNWASWSACLDPDEKKLCCDWEKNPCGGCTPLQNKPNAPCGNGGHYECFGLNQLICKEPPPPPPVKEEVKKEEPKKEEPKKEEPKNPDPPKEEKKIPDPPPPPAPPSPPPPPAPKKNACGGTTLLAANPGTPCGNNGSYECISQEQIQCKEPLPPAPPAPPPKKEEPKIPDPPPKKEEPPPPPAPKKNSCGGTSTLAFTPGTKCGICNGTWQCDGLDNIKCVTTQAFIFDTQKVCGSKYCFQITGTSTTHAFAKLTKIDGKAFGSWPLEWNVANLTNSKILDTPLSSCDKAYTGQTEIQATLNLKYVTSTSPALAQASFYSGTKCKDYEATPTLMIQKCQ